MPIQQITIVGLGLIGGSLGLALRKAGFAGRILGSGRAELIAKGVDRKVIDGGDTDPIAASQGSDVVVLAAPVGAIIDLIERLGPVLPEKTLITDVGSTKREILDRAQKVFGAAAARRFLPGHPLAGKANSGLDHADADLFRDTTWVFCPSTAEAIAEGTLAAEWVRWTGSIGAFPVFLDAMKHDRLCAFTSHLPQLMATGLGSLLADQFGDDPAVAQVSGRGLLDMTRLAASPYVVWRDILATNSANLEDALLRYEQCLAHIRETLRQPQLREEFEAAAEFRNNLLARRQSPGESQ